MKEDGLVGGKTLFAYDTFFNDKNADFSPADKIALASSIKPQTNGFDIQSKDSFQKFRNSETLLSRGGNSRIQNTAIPKTQNYQVDYLTHNRENEESADKSSSYEFKIEENAKLNNKSKNKIYRASDIISRNAQSIKNAGKKYGVNPSIIAACIYSEQILNYNITDVIMDKMYWTNPSVGIGQVAIETAITIENYGKIEPIKYAGKRKEWHGNNYVMYDAWDVPGCGIVVGTKEQAIHKRLSNDEQNIEYVAAYLQLIQDLWREKYPIIDGKSDILATLYNLGENGGKKGINSNPEPNEFGDFAKKNYNHMQYLIGLEQ